MKVKSNFAMTLFTLIIMLAVTYISLATTDTGKKAVINKEDISQTTKVENSNAMKCGTGKCGTGKCGDK